MKGSKGKIVLRPPMLINLANNSRDLTKGSPFLIDFSRFKEWLKTLRIPSCTVVNHSTDTQFWKGPDEKGRTPNGPVTVILCIYIMFLDIQ